MTEDIKPEVIKRTQESLKKFIKKPPLTEKLLKKPPFRFLHDLITSIMRETGFLQGLYTPEELNPDNIKDRDGKIAFLEKLIAAVKLSTGATVNARPAKIVAGLEVEKTNELLQVIGKALEKRIDSSKAVEQIVKKGNKISKAKDTSKSKPSKDVNLDESKTKDKPDVKRKKPSTRSKENVVKESTSKPKQSPINKKDTPSRKKERSPTKQVNENKRKEKTSPSNDSDIIRNEPLRADNKQIDIENKSETAEMVESSTTKEIPVLQKKPSIEKPVLQKNLSVEKQIDRETSVDDDTIDDAEQNLIEVSAEKIESVSLPEHKADSGETEKKIGNAGVYEQDEKKEREKEFKEEPQKIKRPSSAHHGHRRQSSARRISDVENTTDSKAINQTTTASGGGGGDGVIISNLSNSVVASNASENVQVLGASSQGTPNSGEPAVKVSPPPVAARPRTAARPPSARPGAPRVRDRGHVEVVEDTRSPSVPVNVIVDAESGKDEDDENLVVLEAQTAPTEEQMDQTKLESNSESAAEFGLDGKEQGRLVAQILETQRELEISGGTSSKVEIEWEGGRKRERETALKEVDRLRGAIQSLTRAANPLGKLIDFLQEDVDSMQRELIHWQQMNSQLVKELQAEESLTETSLEPLKRQLDELDQLIQDEIEKMSAVKANIIRNDERIIKLLPGMHHS